MSGEAKTLAAVMTRKGVTFGALAEPLYVQLKGIGWATRRRLTYCQDAADAIATLAIGGLLSEAETRRARLRLMKRIARVLTGKKK